MTLLQVGNLEVSFATPEGTVRAVRDVSFTVRAGQTLGIVGESGSGKSVTARTVLGLTRGARISGNVFFRGDDLLGMSEAQRRRVRGAQIGIVFQDPAASLHPHYTVGWQISEMIRAHERASRRQARARAAEWLGLVGIAQPSRRLDQYPHQLSGGMAQRAMLAMALALNPALLIADEPTTALDPTVQAQILELLRRLQREFDTAILLCTHDLAVMANVADDVAVMYAGAIVEHADRATVYRAPHHPYTRGLLRSLPGGDRWERLQPVAGQPPSLIRLPSGCSFHPRCPFVMQRCVTSEPPLRAVAGPAHASACWLPDELVGLTPEVDERRDAVARQRAPSSAGGG